jgi:hypothetical protein
MREAVSRGWVAVIRDNKALNEAADAHESGFAGLHLPGCDDHGNCDCSEQMRYASLVRAAKREWRSCVDYKHFDLSLGSDAGYGDDMPGDTECEKGHWRIGPSGSQRDVVAKFRVAVVSARTCPDFEPQTS